MVKKPGPPANLPHDTPVDVPKVEPSVLVPAAIPSVLKGGAGEALTLLHADHTLEAAYVAWGQVRALRAAAGKAAGEERRRLDEQGALLLGALKRTQATTGQGVSSEAIVKLGDDAGAKLAQARAALEQATRDEAAQVDSAEAAAKQAVRERIQALLAVAPPPLRVSVMTAGAKKVLQAQRPGADEAVLLVQVLCGRAPTRYDALFDDSTDDVLLPPTTLYSDGGVAGDLRPGPAALQAALAPLPEFWPVKAQLPMLPAKADDRFFRWAARGVVLEAEIADGAGFRNLLSADEAEELLAVLLTLRLQGKLGFELSAG